MSSTKLLRELERLPLSDRLLVIEKALKSIRTARTNSLKEAAENLYNDYKSDTELIAFTKLDSASFYEAR